MRPCRHDDPDLHAPHCYACRLYLRDPDYRALWDGLVPPGNDACKTKRALPCVHRGEDVRDENGRAVTRSLG